MHRQLDMGFHLGLRAGGQHAAVAGAASDGQEVTGPTWHDLKDYGSGVLALVVQATLAEDETLTLAVNLQDAADDQGTGAADYGDAFAAAVVLTGPTGGGTVRTIVRIDFSLENFQGYLNYQLTPSFSAANTDTSAIAAAFALGGARDLPAV
jgi:hypothetical protein